MDTPRLMLPLAYTTGGVPVYPVSGAAPDVELDVEPDEEELEEGEESGDEGGKKDKQEGRYTPPSESEWARMRSSLDRANASAKAKREAAAAAAKRIAELESEKADREAAEERRQLLAQQQAQQPPAPGKKGRGAAPAPATPTDLPAGVMTPAQVKAELAKARKAERDAVQSEYVDMARRSAARVALSDAQVPKSSVGRLVRLLDLEEIELDADGEVVGGLEEQIDRLKEELPQLFAPAQPAETEPSKKTRPRPPRIPQANGSARPPAQERKLSTAEQIAEAVLGGR